MNRLLSVFLAAGLLASGQPEAKAFDGFHLGSAAYAPDYYYGFSAPTYFPAPYPAPIYYGGWGTGWGGWAYPGYLSGVRYSYGYYTHLPGYSFTYYRGPIPRYYPGPYGNSPFGGIGDYGYGPYGW